MNTHSFFVSLILVFGLDVCVAEQMQPKWFTDAVQSTQTVYRQAITNLIAGQYTAKQLEDILTSEAEDSANARQARILLARLRYPSVFTEYEEMIKKSRKDVSHGERPGFLAGTIHTFIRKAPESKYVAVRDGWEMLSGETNRPNKIIMRQTKYKQVEKFTDAEVLVGIARNKAARQALLEHFLKFLDDGNGYEQSEVIQLVNDLWGRKRNRREGDLTVIDNVPDADSLIETLFKDSSRPIAARMSAAYCLPNSRQSDIQRFMLDVTTNNLIAEKNRQNWEFLDKALSYLESTADATALSALKSQTNGPKWKTDKVTEATRKIESRLFPRTKDN